MTEEKPKHPSLELLQPIKDFAPSRPTLPEQEADIQRLMVLEAKHKANQEVIKQLQETKDLLEQDESDLAELQRQVLELIKQRLLKK